MIIYFRFSCFLFKIQILHTEISKQQVISFFFGSVLVKIWAFKKGQIRKSQNSPFHENLVFEFLFYFFSKNHPEGVKSVGEYNFNLF
jgi:hypothetical protein